MPRGGGGFGIALVVLSILTMLLFAALRNESQECAACESSASKLCPRPASCFITNKIPLAAPAGFPAAPDKSYKNDLEAQQWMAWSSVWMVFLTGAGVILIAATLRETGQVLREARETTDAAVDAAAAAWKTEETTRDIGQKQSMAYVHVVAAYTPGQEHGDDELLNALSNLNAKLVVEVENIGNTVAKYVSLDVELAFERGSEGWPTFRELRSPSRIETSNIAPSQKIPIEVFQNLVKAAEVTKEEIEVSMALRTLRGIVTYESVFGEKYRTAFIYLVFFRTHEEVAPENKVEYIAFPFTGPAFERVVEIDSERDEPKE